ncbi:MAG: S8 family serine peptidase [Candidatus Eisenbacteria bacterium]|nr:S8 family serine peptidase [Candidatus Eisenbacteria bacterium]
MKTPATARLLLSGLLVALLVSGAAQAATVHLSARSFDPLLEEPDVEPSLRAATPAPQEDAYYIVQLSGPPSDGRKNAVDEAGGKLIAYIPDWSYIVRMTPEVAAGLTDEPDVTWVGPFHPAYKLSPTIGEHEFRHPRRARDPLLTLMVRVFADLEGTAARVEELGGQVQELVDDGFQKLVVVRAAPRLVNEIARLRDVWWIEEKPEFYLMNDQTRWVVQSNVSPETPIWDKGLHGEDQIVGVMDSGLDYNSCWFRETGGAAPGPSHRKVIDYSLYGGAAYDGCDVGHGTHVCGTLAGDQSYVNPGNYDYNGMAYESKLILQDIGQDDEWSCSTGQVAVPTSCATAYTDAYNLGARIHSNSWGGTENSYDSYASTVDNFMWSNPDFLIVFAAGNAGSGSGTVGYPGTAKNCITVGATRRPPQQDVIAGYSSRGPASDGRTKPTVVAPGGEAGYSYVNSADNDMGNPPAMTCNVASSPFQGTSMATPAVAGCAALVRQYYEEGWYPSGSKSSSDEFNPSAALVKATVLNSATDIASADIPNQNEGWGRVLLDDALYFDADARELIAEDVSPGVSQGGSQTFEFEIDSSGVPLEIVLVWTDYPASAGAGVAIQNDLDLTVTCAGGTVFKGNVMSGGQSATGGSYDNLNVEEVVRLESPPAGTYTIQVDGTTVPHGPQPFALVSTGSFANWPAGSGLDDHAISGEAPFAFTGITPNPFNPLTEIAYELRPVATGDAHVTLRVYTVDGRLVTTLVDRVQDPGHHKAVWNGTDADGRAAASGIYFCELSYGGEKATSKMTLLK